LERKCIVNKNNNTDKPNKTTAKELDQMAIAGIKKYFANVPKITLGGTDYSAATLTAVLQAEIDALLALGTSKSQLRQQVADTQTIRVSTRAVRALLRKYILATYGNKALAMLGDFGMKEPKNVGKRTAEVKAKASAKARATREAKKNALKNATSQPATPVAASVGTTSAKQ
jgi:hypothetical protein